MLENAQTVDSKTLVRIKEEGFSSMYRFADANQEYMLQVRHQKTKARNDEPEKDRHNVELVITTYATADAPKKTKKVYIVVEQPPEDTTTTLAESLIAWLASGTVSYDTLKFVQRWES